MYAVTFVYEGGVCTTLYEKLEDMKVEDISFGHWMDRLYNVSGPDGGYGDWHKELSLREAFDALFDGEVEGFCAEEVNKDASCYVVKVHDEYLPLQGEN